MEEKRLGSSMGVSVGSATLVMLFAVLCLTLFSVMALVTANQEWQLAKKSAQSVTDYYAADTLAAQVYHALPPFSTTLDGTEVAGISISQESDGTLAYAVPVDDRQSLNVSLQWNEEEGRWNILSWVVVQTADWTADQHLDVWNGG